MPILPTNQIRTLAGIYEKSISGQHPDVRGFFGRFSSQLPKGKSPLYYHGFIDGVDSSESVAHIEDPMGSGFLEACATLDSRSPLGEPVDYDDGYWDGVALVGALSGLLFGMTMSPGEKARSEWPFEAAKIVRPELERHKCPDRCEEAVESILIDMRGFAATQYIDRACSQSPTPD